MKRIALILLVCLPFSLFAQENAIEKQFPNKKGNLRFSRESIKLNYVKSTEIRRDSVEIYNAGNKAIDMSVSPVSNYLKPEVRPARLEPGKKGVFLLSYDAQAKGDYGNSFEGVTIKTNDSLEPDKYFFVMAYIEEDFSGLSKEERDNAPRIKFDKEGHDFGKVKNGEKIDCSFTFTNTGKRDLIIRKTKASCGCTATDPEKTVLKPGESSKINVKIDTSSLHGEQSKSVFVFCNDPVYSAVTLQLTGTVE